LISVPIDRRFSVDRNRPSYARTIPVSVERLPRAVAARKRLAERLRKRRMNGTFVVLPFFAYGEAMTIFASVVSSSVIIPPMCSGA
jgi:hypothetical protein